jgi:ribokinase
VVTLGGHGVFVSHPDGARRGDALAHYRIAAADVRAVDTTGAGDAFSGALAAALAQAPGQPFAAAAAFANRYAALSTERHGAALAMPRLEELQRRFAVS